MAFSFRAGTNWCHDFPKLARESGFYFNMHGSRVRVDWNRIGAIDIDRVIRERDFSSIDQNINNVIDYCLESEYDVKILDPSFVKLFRLAQLSVEYLLYCKQYLDHSVIILKDELRQKIEQNINMKKEIAALEDTVKNLKERSKEKRKLIETSIGEISNGEVYKCPHCPKTFVRAIFVNAHIARKHSYISDMGVSISPVHDHYRAETEKLHNEIKTLKERLNQTERVIRNESDKLQDNIEKDYSRNISRNEYDISRVDRFQEQRRYQEDIGSLKSMLFDEIRALREKDHVVNESILETNVKTLISQQEKEIENLRNQLLERLTPGMENMQVKLQTQENHWKAKIEDMEAQHHQDIEKLTTELKATQQIADHIKSDINAKKLVRYNQIKQKILEDVLQRISANHKEPKYSTLTAKSLPLDKLVTHVKSKAWKAFNKDNGEYTSIQKTENTTPLKLRLKQKIELLPKKYKDEVHENIRESPLKKNGADTYTSPKVTPVYSKSVRSISSASSIESQEDIKQISPMKITVSDTIASKMNSPISKKQIVTPKLFENNDSDSTIMPDDSVLSPKNKSVLKPTSGSVGSLVKKKVLFDLNDKKNDDTLITENDQRKNQINNDWKVSSFAENGEYALQKEKSMSTGNIVLKTSQSDKIAEISKKIQEQLSISRKPPAGSVETIFRVNTSTSQDFMNYNAENQLLNSTSLMSSILDSPMRNFTNPKAKGNIFPQPAPRTLKDKDSTIVQRKNEIKYSDLDSDIDEILQME
ncbi:Zinc finger protein DZIP1L [Cyphomyrmex costatus]|uniref:Zinc finger protein DZIP1L n=1 Tax=Cyphomyrmex costatus TaxID=456900 RepID=A0A195C7H9_9HYME|nr:Zinc finger protein DZIP1L [Cyphomyrmex costatus]